LRIGLAQLNPTVGDLDGNATLITDAIDAGRAAGAGLVVCPELCLPGYPAEDLYLKRHFLAANRAALERIASATDGVTAVVGFAEPVEAAAAARPDAPAARPAYNAVAVLRDGRIESIYRKSRLPNYGVFDEARYFEAGSGPLVVEVDGAKVGITICEDVWEPGPPASEEATAGATLIVNASGSPYLRGKGRGREEMFAERARAYGAAFAFCNLVGGQDELVFDGHSFIVDASGEVVARAAQFEPELLIWDIGGPPGRMAKPLNDLDEVYAALVLGARDYARKNGFERALVGLSGGIDSALVALVAAEALGPANLTCVVMPSPHSSEETQADARAIATNLGAERLELPIEPAMDAYAEILGERWSGEGLAAENVQARIRGNLLMAISNDRGELVLTTGNKSEMAVGYATLYGDMAGGLAVIKDVPKGLVYELVRHRNERAGRELVPASVLERAPSAELRPDQRDADSLPDYGVLDHVLEGYVERDLSAGDLAGNDISAELVAEIIGMVDRAEYKRRQAPPGIRITSRAFGRDRRLPITNRFGG
jgi:NAD+ synthase (glutamine-hydrolysing)